MEHLIANSGIHFIVREIEFNSSEPLILSSGKALKYSFIETDDFINNSRIFNLLYDNQGVRYIPIDALLNSQNNAVIRRPNGREKLDESGMVLLNPDCDITLLPYFTPNNPEIYSINNLESFRVEDPLDGHSKVSAFELLLGKWLPMPLFQKEIDGITGDYPLGWCRMKIDRIGKTGGKGVDKYRLTWVFDTQTAADPFSCLRPFIDESGDSAEFCMCNKVDLLLNFMSSGEDFHAFSDYVASLLGLGLSGLLSFKFKAYYIYFLNFIRLVGGAPEVVLHNNAKKEIPVDLVLDIGNSRTCGILFEDGEFTKGKMLELRDLTSPWICYENKSFDMRVVFRKADFGNDIVLDEELFKWKSFVRVGEEARRLVYRSLDDEGISEKTTSYSSPKRYLWDKKLFEGQWENLITTEDPFNVLDSNEISVPVLSSLFDNDGMFNPQKRDDDSDIDLLDLNEKKYRYSRSSLMTFAFVEIFQHALSQINSLRYRDQWGKVDCRRFIRNVIITCPTAMPLAEQIFLRQSAEDAYKALTICTPEIKMAEIIPSAASLMITDPYADLDKKVWMYDEASCCQLVYLCAEITQRYGGETHKFFELKGHVRPELRAQGYINKALTIGSIDIGAGTTDIMVCSYEYEGQGNCKITPTPLFWDSFYLAGDEILRNIIQNIVIEGPDHRQDDLGNITAAVTSRILKYSNDNLLKLPCLDNIVYLNKIQDVCITVDEEERREKLIAFASNLVHDFFGADSSMMGYRDRRCRTDFNTQISVPIAQFMMELLRTHRPSKLYTYGDIFPDNKPADYLLDYFEHHFGFRFEELNWRFDPQEIAAIVKSTMEPLMKQMAMVLYTQHCDIIVLSGRPSSLDPITELFIKYVPTSPDRLVRLNDYRVGSWFPTADGQGFFYDQKAIVAVGGMVGYRASHTGLKGLVIDFSKMIKKMTSTANYLGEYNSKRQQVTQYMLSPTVSSATLIASVFPVFIGCRQLNSDIYQARPLYALYNHGNASTLQIRLSRSFQDNKEKVEIEEATDGEYRNKLSDLELVQQSLVDDGKYWLDKGEFELTIK